MNLFRLAVLARIRSSRLRRLAWQRLGLPVVVAILARHTDATIVSLVVCSAAVVIWLASVIAWAIGTVALVMHRRREGRDRWR